MKTSTELRIVVVAGKVRSEKGTTTEVRAISIEYSYEPKLISSIGLADQVNRTIPYFAFANRCGLPLSTARVASNNEVVLIYDLFQSTTALIWNISEKKVSVVTSDFDPKSGYLCNGKVLRIDNDLEYIAFDRDARTIAIRGTIKDSPTVRASF